MPKKEKLDPETEALIQWCTEVEKFLVKGGATLEQAQQHIEEEVEWFTDQFYMYKCSPLDHRYKFEEDGQQINCKDLLWNVKSAGLCCGSSR